MNSTRKTISKVLFLHVLDSELQGLLFQCARLSLISDVARDVLSQRVPSQVGSCSCES